MRKFCVVLAVLVAGLLLSGCRSAHSGSREFVPGQGWIHTD